MGWKIIEINSDEYMKLYLNNLLIERPNGNITINIKDIDTLIIDNNRSVMSIRLMNALSSQNVNTIIFNNKHEPGSFLFPVIGNHNSLKVLEKQINWTKEYKGKMWQDVVKNKINSQLSLLKLLDLNKLRIEEMEKLKNKVEIFDINNREGHAAKIYWHTLFHKKFYRDQSAKQFPLINAMLNYGYTILRGMVIRSIIKKGLDTRISLFHKSFSNFFALASDIMEPFRPFVDYIVFKNQNIFLFDLKTREEILKQLSGKVIINGQKHYLNNAIDQCIDSMIAGDGWKWVDIWE